MAPTREVTELLRRMRAGDEGAADRLVPLIYDELHQLAARFLRGERKGHTLQTTALVHEAYLRLVDQQQAAWTDRTHFMAVAATLIRRILIDHARHANAERRGGGKRPASLDAVGDPVAVEDPDTLLAIDEALVRLASLDARKARVVELRFFGGLTVDQTATVLSVSPATVDRDWHMARAWLYREVDGAEA